MNLETALRQASDALQKAGVAAHRLTAEVLLLHAIRGDRTVLRAHPERELTDLEQLHFARYLHERISGKPTQYITGRQEFWGLDIHVNPSVLIPRPETEHVVERAVAIGGNVVVDCGTGSGCIALALAKDLAGAKIYATDLSRPAIDTAFANSRRLGLPIQFVQSDLLACFSDASLDLTVSNPPYVALADADTLSREVRDHEPSLALFAGQDGTDVYRRLIPEAARTLRPGGWLVLELGYTVVEAVRELFAVPGWGQPQTDRDLAGIERVIYAPRT